MKHPEYVMLGVATLHSDCPMEIKMLKNRNDNNTKVRFKFDLSNQRIVEDTND